MKVSNLPGFNAEASLFRSNSHYQLETVHADTQESQAGSVQPAMKIIKGTKGFCVDSVIGYWCCDYNGNCWDMNSL